jgi:hypothetical protein
MNATAKCSGVRLYRIVSSLGAILKLPTSRFLANFRIQASRAAFPAHHTATAPGPLPESCVGPTKIPPPKFLITTGWLLDRDRPTLGAIQRQMCEYVAELVRRTL